MNKKKLQSLMRRFYKITDKNSDIKAVIFFETERGEVEMIASEEMTWNEDKKMKEALKEEKL